MGVSTYRPADHFARRRPASRRIEQRKHADERDDDAAEPHFRCAGRAQGRQRVCARFESRRENKAIEEREENHDRHDDEFRDQKRTVGRRQGDWRTV